MTADAAGSGGGRRSRRGRRRWQDDPDLRTDVPAAESLCGWSFRDPLPAVVALHPHLGGFSRLEFLGDAVLNLAVYTAASLAGVGRDVAVAAVANASLDIRINASAISSARRSGDVLEALVGAVHLDGGFPPAWVASLRIAGDAAGVPGDLDPPPGGGRPDRGSLDRRAGAFVGAALLGAVVADRLCRTEPDWPHDRYSEQRSSLLGTGRLAELARAHLGPLVGNGNDASCVDVLQATVADRFLDGGWEEGVAAAIDAGVLPP